MHPSACTHLCRIYTTIARQFESSGNLKQYLSYLQKAYDHAKEGELLLSVIHSYRTERKLSPHRVNFLLPFPATVILFGLTRSEKTSVMTTPKCPGSSYLADLPGWSNPPLPIKHTWLDYCYTKLGRCTPLPIKHRSHKYCYTKLGRSNPPSTGILWWRMAISNFYC